jgi:YidC/Oxa1 family membrane protein insertase
MQRIQPQVKQIQEKHKKDMQAQSAALMALYKEHGVNPFSSILLLILQLPIMIGFYWVVRSGLTASQFTNLYSFVASPGVVSTMFLHVINLASANWIVLIAAAASQFFQARLAIWRQPGGGPLSQAQKIASQMSYIAPVMTIVIFYTLPSAVALYWFVSSVFSMVQQYFVNRHLKMKYGN